MNSITSILGYTPKKIGVFKTASMADLPNDIRLFRSLKSSFPEATLVWISSKDSKELVKRFSGVVNEYINCPNYANHNHSHLNFSWFTEAMQQQQWDVIIQIDSNKPSVDKWLELWNPRLLVRYSLESACPFKHTLVLSLKPALAKECVQTHLLNSLGIPASPNGFQFPSTESDKRAFTQLYPELFQHPFVCIHMENPAVQTWPMCYYTMIAYLLADHGYSLVFIANEKKQTSILEICQHIESPTFSFLRENLCWSNLAYLINQSSLVIGDDTDMAQLAVHLDVPSVWLSTRGHQLQFHESRSKSVHILKESQPIKEVIHEISTLLHLNQENFW
ncbi:glycosyltransferase family 9 protein [Siphonobacter sp. SORGH_AS_1065]|uniref:glycosyltransferase family 9 protein n=1 Tax=Siphonobacter sp. SORGH_AS_1065 TaxID=3041795 RepID=UPI002789BBA6|nr:glycosyltransferase family 9 protein [Siphonobacter sp. SORGH_AS_1065]MDQ1090282.1 ADP-heptose:LPS heptosyltransferase [Siphonobacter sp. SORGH_AS_1065]